MYGNYTYDFDYIYDDYSSNERLMNPNNSTIASYGLSWPSLTRCTLVILLRIGFVLIHVGSVPINNVNLILLQNLVDFCWVTVTYILVGYIIAYNGDINGLIGQGYWIGHAGVDKDEAIIGWSAVVIAAAICTSGIVGRTHTVGYLVIGFLQSALLQPFLIHWAWTPKGWMRGNTLQMKDVRFQDYSGSAVVHLVGGLSGMIGCMTLGRRILLLSAIDDASIAAGSSGTVFAGQLLVLIGLQSLSIPHVPLERLRPRSINLNSVYVNNLLAASTSSLLVVALHFMASRVEFSHWTVLRCIQATIAGLVTISAAANIYSPQLAICAAAIGSLVFYSVSKCVFRSALEDYCNIVAIHVVCAILGSLLAPFFGYDEDETVPLILLNFSWQLIGVVTVIVLVSCVMCIAFAFLAQLELLRNRSEYSNHMRALLAAERGPPRSYFQRLFYPDDDATYLQPGLMLAPDLRRDQRQGVGGEPPS